MVLPSTTNEGVSEARYIATALHGTKARAGDPERTILENSISVVIRQVSGGRSNYGAITPYWAKGITTCGSCEVGGMTVSANETTSVR